jgi:mitofusin
MHIGKEVSLPVTGGERQLKMEDVQEAYVEQKDR